MKKFYFLLIVFVLIIQNSYSVVAVEEFHWESIDKQETMHVKKSYIGEHLSALSTLQELANKNDSVGSYHLGLVHDLGANLVICGGYRECDIRVYNFPEKIKRSAKLTKKWYLHAHDLGHPYAAYMLSMNYTARFKPVAKKIKTMALERIYPLYEKGDGLATYIYYDLEGKFTLSPNTNKSSTDKTKKKLKETIKKLEKEALEGRVLAMHYLGKAYLNLWDYPKAFAWFHVAHENGYLKSAYYRQNVYKLVKQDKKHTEKEVLQEMNRVINLIENHKRAE